MENLIGWLNSNSGAVTALATIGTVLFTAIAASAAWVSIMRSRNLRKSRHVLDISLTDNHDSYDIDSDKYLREALELRIWNVGAAPANTMRYALVEYRIGRLREGGGPTFRPPAPGSSTGFSLKFSDESLGAYIMLSWIDQDGKNRKLRRWYSQAVPLDHDDSRRRNQRSDLKFQDPLQRLVDRPRRLSKRPPVKLWLRRRQRARMMLKQLRQTRKNES